MITHRFALTSLAMGFVLILSPSADAGDYPVKALRLIVPFPPGAGTDMFGRTIAQKLNENMGEPVVVDNKPGGGATLGTDFVAKSHPDGYTLLLSTTSHAINPSVYPTLPYDTLKDFATVTQVANVPTVLVVHPSVPVKTVQELVSLAKAKPGALNFGSSGSGTIFHLAAELFKSMAGIEIVHVPYKGGGPAMAALLGGEVNVLFETTLTVASHAKAGKLRLLAVGSVERSSTFPELPTIAESGFPGFNAVNWYGIYVRNGTPKQIVDRLNHEIVRALNLPDVRERFTSQGADLVGSTPEQHSVFLKSEMDKWQRIARQAHVKVD